jgi:hypothetical protein
MAKKNGQLSGQRTSVKQRGTARVSHDSGPAAATSPAAAQPSWEDVARRAYEIFLTRGGVDGRDVEDWLAAERELRRLQH